MDSFSMNGYDWQIKFVDPDSEVLVDRSDTLRVATTDIGTQTVYLSNNLDGRFLMHVFIHELGHCALFSFHLLDRIHSMVYPEYWIAMEEWVCNFIADYGELIFSIAYQTFGYAAWRCVPDVLERMIA